MAKKQSQKSAEVEKQVKFRVPEGAHALLRTAAALEGCAVSEFCCRGAVAHARIVIEEKLPGMLDQARGGSNERN